MLIAIPSEDNMVSAHFGHCSEFTLFATDTREFKTVKNPGHQPGFLPGFLKELGAELVIAGGMGGRAQELFAAQGIQLIVGVSGNIKDVIKLYEQGQLKSTGAVCSEHAHAGDCHS
ncbi:Dinitrogenase iron-molybdenum cofactor biosynthesis [Syntrophomonas zehnderi OL-4]|uniref:Dinitrogenase iron-molybdenum cofactor biosynthesis n=1 Tax=Syntrophomonas zehnderi OL-4 TaxID=690567 RepID=A0A0E4GCM8_9FIRM|nr:NifB/NifX family molybdenum-iron cluster-binding protein [Syntrophomonas zehnderi]CFX17399.1 Dinitrogenase iron-molybdenum cofactor biosynthesis [Syntrophomonas zehnderi OL-4]